MNFLDRNARPTNTASVTTATAPVVSTTSMVVCPACFLEQVVPWHLSYVAGMYRAAYAAAERSVRRREACARDWSEPSRN
jgi:hypothetical protein